VDDSEALQLLEPGDLIGVADRLLARAIAAGPSRATAMAFRKFAQGLVAMAPEPPELARRAPEAIAAAFWHVAFGAGIDNRDTFHVWFLTYHLGYFLREQPFPRSVYFVESPFSDALEYLRDPSPEEFDALNTTVRHAMTPLERPLREAGRAGVRAWSLESAFATLRRALSDDAATLRRAAEVPYLKDNYPDAALDLDTYACEIEAQLDAAMPHGAAADGPPA
jgi:hypothetical protein